VAHYVPLLDHLVKLRERPIHVDRLGELAAAELFDEETDVSDLHKDFLAALEVQQEGVFEGGG